ncbi:MAG: two-component system sensor histidine kinase PilS (NtrC family) [Pseudohongiellaceae bacterium]|jgi:two-component system sensor histidine kinase PilS (NtrC family)
MAERAPQYTGQIDNVSIVYNIYRIVLPLVLLVTYLSDPARTFLGEVDPTLFLQVSIAYIAFGVVVVSLFTTATKVINAQHFLSATLILDILATTLIIYSCGGISSGLGLLIIVTVASGSILIRGRISTFLAAVATLSIIYSELYLALSSENGANQFVQTGILGAILFATSLYIQAVTDRIYKTALLADKQAKSIVDLEKLNNEIIQRMRTGVVVVNHDHEIVSMNSAAKSTLAPLLDRPREKRPSDLIDINHKLPDALEVQLELWKINPKRQPQPIRIPNSNKQVQLNFAFLRPELEADILVFLEDNRQIVQRVRQMKLASLGRLTASIAHEIRNPLGAISHASQLLKESETASLDDKRMIEIILEHCNRVNMIIEDVLDVSRHDDTLAQKIVLKPWLEDFIENYKATHDQCDEIELTIEESDTRVSVILGQLEQVLNNLFDNGLRYSKQNSNRATLQVIAGFDSKDGDYQPYIHVIDDGIGITESDEALLFEPFHTTESSGTGLGLYISKELCEANQSQLSYRKTEEGKSCFSIYFSHPERSIA